LLFLEEYARYLLVLHTALALATVAVSTHLVLWLRKYPAGTFDRIAAVRRFANWSAVLFVVTFIGGNLIYPVYKVRVRKQYLESGIAVTRDAEVREEMTFNLQQRYNLAREADGEDARPDLQLNEPGTDGPHTTARIARWFDVKEHWVALGMALALALAFIVRRWNPRQQGDMLAPVVFALAVAAASTAWFAAVVGVVVSSYRAVGGL